MPLKRKKKKTLSHSAGKVQHQRRQKRKSKSKSKPKSKSKSRSKPRSKSKSKSKSRSKSKSKEVRHQLTVAALADPLLNQTVDQGRILIGPKIGAGSFGQVRTGIELATGRPLAVKVAKSGDDQLAAEVEIYRKLAGNKGFAQLFCTVSLASHDLLALELLSVDLEGLFKRCGRHFSRHTVAYIALQMFERLADLHLARFLYRDVKPENFMLSRDRVTVKLIDFGLAEELIDSTGRHKPPGKTNELVGTERFMSINAHLGFQLSRRDDLEALGYIFAYFLRGGRLPWFDVYRENMNDQNREIGEMKKATSPAKLFKGYPQVFADYIQYTRALDFFQTPNYQLLQRKFAEYYRSTFKGSNKVLDWNL